MRNREIDQLKGFGLVLIIINHVIPFINYGHNLIQSFHVPMFFIVSGYLYKKRTVQETAKKKFNSLLIPFICFFIFYIIIDYFGGLFNNLYYDNYNRLRVLTDTTSIPINGGIWFLYVLFMCTVIYSILDNHLKSTKTKDLIIIFLAILSFMYTRFISYRLPLSIEIIPIALLFYLVGIKIKTTKKVLNLSISKELILLIILLISVYINGFVNLNSTAYNYEILYVLNSIIGTIFFWNIFILLKNNKNIIIEKIKQYLEFINRNAITIICTNQMLNLILKSIISINNSIIKSLIIIVLILIICPLLNILLSKSKLRIILGKRDK